MLKVSNIWWSDEETFYIEFTYGNTTRITTLSWEEFEKSRIALNIPKHSESIMLEDTLSCIAFHALQTNPPKIDNLPYIESSPPLLRHIYHVVKDEPQSMWEYDSKEVQAMFHLNFEDTVAVLQKAATKYDFTDVLDINEKKKEISVYGDILCRFQSKK